jgi:ATP-binding cassette subfamily B protein
MPILTITSSSIIGISILITMFYISSWLVLIVAIFFAIIYLLVNCFTKKKLLNNSDLISRQSTVMIQNIQESLGGIRDVLLSGTQELYVNNYAIADRKFRTAQSSNVFIGASPKIIIESFGITLIAISAFFLVNFNEGGTHVIPVLGFMALGAQRLLPIFQQLYGSWTTIQGSYGSFQDAIKLLEQPLPKNIDIKHLSPPIIFRQYIDLHELSFRHNSSQVCIENVNLRIFKGEKIGIIGETGVGKSTLLDLVMGLLKPDSGSISIDGVVLNDENIFAWHKRLAHVPQYIHLTDATVAENIAFGTPLNAIEFDKVKLAAKLACIHDDIIMMQSQYETLVGERGVKLSGGQRQRIGIARAFYKGADVIILDEATSALDNETESKVMSSFYETNHNQVTILMVAHRTSTLKSCSRIIEVKNGSTLEVNSM